MASQKSIIDPFPMDLIKCTQSGTLEHILRNLSKEINDPIICNSHLDLLIHVIDNPELQKNYKNLLKTSEQYKQWQGAMPDLKDVPLIHNYRHAKPIDIEQFNNEVIKYGHKLPVNLRLFRGGSIDNTQIQRSPLSTSLLPTVAIWHADNDKQPSNTPQISILTISTKYIKGFVYKTTGNQKFTRECEILIQGDITLKETHQLWYNGYIIKEYECLI